MIKNFVFWVTGLSLAAGLAAGAIEKVAHRRNLARIPVRILVNGTRGKTSVARMMAGALREAGVRTWAKSTGTQAAWVLPDGEERPCRAAWKKTVNIREQIPFVRRAARDGAQALVVECMALHAENQRMMGEEFVRPTIVIVTNAWVDHVEEIGSTVEETCETLALSVPKGAALISGETGLDKWHSGRIDPGAEEVTEQDLAGFGFPVFKENVQAVLAAAKLLGIEREAALRGMRSARPDPGMMGPFTVGSCRVVNAFAANDSVSAGALIERTLADGEAGELRILFNNRGDREFRLSEFAGLVRSLGARGAHLVTVGEHALRAARYFSRHCAIAAKPLAGGAADWVRSLAGTRSTVLCMGNIKGEGLRLIEELARKEGERQCSDKPSR